MNKPVIIGGASVDVRGRPEVALLHGSSSIGTVQQTTGGVALNVALNLSRLEIFSDFITVIGRDPDGEYLECACRSAHLDTRCLICSPEEKTARYHAIIDERGELYAGISAMQIFHTLTPSLLKPFEDILDQAPMIIADCNPPPETLHYLAARCALKKTPLWVEPTSADKCRKIFPLTAGITYLSPNKEELETLAGRACSTERDIIECARSLTAEGIEQIFVTLGGDGVLWVNEESAILRKIPPVQVKDVTGAGDAFVAGVVYALLQDISIPDAIDYGLSAAIATVKVYESVNQQLCSELLLTTLKEWVTHERHREIPGDSP